MMSEVSMWINGEWENWNLDARTREYHWVRGDIGTFDRPAKAFCGVETIGLHGYSERNPFTKVCQDCMNMKTMLDLAE